MDPIGLSIPETSRALSGSDKPISRTTIYRLLQRGELTKLKVGSRTLIAADSIKAYANRLAEAA